MHKYFHSNKKFVFGFVFVFAVGIVLTSIHVLKTRAGAGDTIAVSLSAGSTNLVADATTMKASTDITIGATAPSSPVSCGSYVLGQPFSTGQLAVGSHDFTVQCSSPSPAATCDTKYIDADSSCFIADTTVLMADGTSKNIQDVEVGDVLKGEKTNNKVLGFHRPELDGELYSFNGGRYFVTEEHPFKTTEGWKSMNPKRTEKENLGIDISLLEVGDILLTEKGNVLLKSIDSKVGDSNTQLYNFKLDGDHTYYADGYLVHNKTNCGGTYTCGGSSVCLYNAISQCTGTVVGSTVGNRADGSPIVGPYEGQNCSSFDRSTCEAGWITHGCNWEAGAYQCAACPGSCPTGYTASCVANKTQCVENAPCKGTPAL